jgi:hypothetical protein
MNFNFPGQNPLIPRSYMCDTLEGNWYEDRCISDYDKRKKKNYQLPNPNAWQYEKTYGELGTAYKDFPKTKERFSESNDNCINFGEKDNNMYITTTRHMLDPNYKETFRPKARNKDYFHNKQEELQEYRNTWTKRTHNFETTYKNDVLTKTASKLILSENKFTK